jgi:hypothetical protein
MLPVTLHNDFQGDEWSCEGRGAFGASRHVAQAANRVIDVLRKSRHDAKMARGKTSRALQYDCVNKARANPTSETRSNPASEAKSTQ